MVQFEKIHRGGTERLCPERSEGTLLLDKQLRCRKNSSLSSLPKRPKLRKGSLAFARDINRLRASVVGLRNHHCPVTDRRWRSWPSVLSLDRPCPSSTCCLPSPSFWAASFCSWWNRWPPSGCCRCWVDRRLCGPRAWCSFKPHCCSDICAHTCSPPGSHNARRWPSISACWLPAWDRRA